MGRTFTFPLPPTLSLTFFAFKVSSLWISENIKKKMTLVSLFLFFYHVLFLFSPYFRSPLTFFRLDLLELGLEHGSILEEEAAEVSDGC